MMCIRTNHVEGNKTVGNYTTPYTATTDLSSGDLDKSQKLANVQRTQAEALRSKAESIRVLVDLNCFSPQSVADAVRTGELGHLVPVDRAA